VQTVKTAEIDLGKSSKDIEARLAQFQKDYALMLRQYEIAFAEVQKQGAKIDLVQLPEFIKHYWHVTPTKNPNEWEVAVPIIFPFFSVGHWDRTENGYNVFVLNRYTQWFGEKIPDFLRHEVNIPPSLDIKCDKDTLKFPEDKRDLIEKKFGKHLSLIEKGHATIIQGHEFDLIAEIIDSGSLPFEPCPVAEADLMESDFTQIYDELESTETNPVYHPLNIFEGKYSYQGDAWKTLLQYGATGIFWAMSFGKTVIGTYVFSRIKGPKALVVNSITLKQQWTEFFKHNCPRLLQEVEIYTYQGMSQKSWKELSSKHYMVIIFDECHFLPANCFSKLATLKTKYRVGLSATPYREDGRANLIMALTGYPQGLDWQIVMKKLGKDYHTVNIHVVKDIDAKYALASQLYNPERRTIFFVYRLDVGEKLAKMFDIPFFSGEGKDNDLATVLKSRSFVASKRYEHGLSIKDLEHIIETDFQFGGRQEEMQRTGRLMHSESTGKTHDIVVTQEELEKYGKRFHALYEKGFKPRLITHLANSGLTLHAEKNTGKHLASALPKDAKNWRKEVRVLYAEGFFRRSRYNSDVTTELKKRGVSESGNMKTQMSDVLTGMVQAKLLYKTPTAKGIEYIMRDTK